MEKESIDAMVEGNRTIVTCATYEPLITRPGQYTEKTTTFRFQKPLRLHGTHYRSMQVESSQQGATHYQTIVTGEPVNPHSQRGHVPVTIRALCSTARTFADNDDAHLRAIQQILEHHDTTYLGSLLLEDALR